MDGSRPASAASAARRSGALASPPTAAAAATAPSWRCRSSRREPPALEPLGEWGKLIADYRSTGIALGKHPMELMRPGLDPALVRSTELERIEDGSEVEVAGMVVARQRPETAKGIVFMLLEDERGTVNLVVRRRVYERRRAIVRTAVMVRAGADWSVAKGSSTSSSPRCAELERTSGPAARSAGLAPQRRHEPAGPQAGHRRAARRRPGRAQLRPPRPLKATAPTALKPNPESPAGGHLVHLSIPNLGKS